MRFEPADVLPDSRIVSPSAERNKGPIAAVLMELLPERGGVLEVSSGTGQHIVHFAQSMPHLRWQPTEYDADNLKSIASWLERAYLSNVNAPIFLDVHDEVWPATIAAGDSLTPAGDSLPPAGESLTPAGDSLTPAGDSLANRSVAGGSVEVAAVVCLNMIHIAPPSATEALVRGAANILRSGGILFLYGPFRREGRHTSASNEAFDQLLRCRNPDWGVRNLEDVALLATSAGFQLQEIKAMPANNFAVAFSKQ